MHRGRTEVFLVLWMACASFYYDVTSRRQRAVLLIDRRVRRRLVGLRLPLAPHRASRPYRRDNVIRAAARGDTGQAMK